jgi:acyl carrier protein
VSGDKLKRVFIETLGIPPTTDLETLAYRSIEAWDSVAHMQLVAALESAFDIMLETDDVIGLSSYPKAREILAKYGVTF